MDIRNSLFLVVDMQKDFCPGGALGVPGGHDIIPHINRMMQWFEEQGRPVFLSRDWHPEETVHFREEGGPWPPHCIQGTEGAEFCDNLDIPDDARILSKGMRPDRDYYSAWEAVDSREQALPQILEEKGIHTLYIAGMATDYCVRATSMDALENGYDVVVFTDGVRGVNAEDSENALNEIRAKGGRVLPFAEFTDSQPA